MQLVIEGLDQLLSAFDKAGVELPDQFRRAMVASTVEVKQTAQALVPVRTSALRTSIFEKTDTNPLQGTVGVGQPYGAAVEFGSRPHTILPKAGKVLAFKVGGSMVFARRVNHPGAAAKPFMQPALNQNIKKINSFFTRAVVNVLEEIARRTR